MRIVTIVPGVLRYICDKCGNKYDMVKDVVIHPKCRGGGGIEVRSIKERGVSRGGGIEVLTFMLFYATTSVNLLTERVISLLPHP